MRKEGIIRTSIHYSLSLEILVNDFCWGLECKKNHSCLIMLCFQLHLVLKAITVFRSTDAKIITIQYIFINFSQ